MKNVLLQNAVKLNKNRKRRKLWQRVLQTMAFGVVFCTTYVLILPAITLEEEPVCGCEAHIHSDACYAQPRAELSQCDLPADAIVIHQHSDLCRDENGALICTLPEQTLHIHDESCYTLEKVLSCTATHVHSQECTTKKELVCQIPESEGHTHSPRCSGTQTVLICSKEPHAHDQSCYEEQTLICNILESEDHTHGPECTGTQQVLICTKETHTHDQSCNEEQTLTCTIPESEGHAHGEACYEIIQIPCTEPTAEDHVHTDACWQQTQTLTCEKQELQLHQHEQSCYDAEGNLVCTLPVVVEHIHTEACLAVPQSEEPVLVCTLQEHTHTEACYPLEEEETLSLEYHCGYAVHTHIDSCYHNDGTLACTIPEHTHEAKCVVEDLDLTADMEWSALWEEETGKLEFTGVWSEDLLTVAKSQLGYAESKRNCILKNDRLLGYTRYSDWGGKYYEPWDDLFVAFCLHYAQIPEETLPWEAETVKWIELLTEMQMYRNAGDHTPVPGDIVFWDSDDDEKADMSGILAEITEENALLIIAGDTKNNKVEELVFRREDAEKILGYCPLPLSPLSQEQWQAAEHVNSLLAQLPQAQTLAENLRKLNEDGDKAGYNALHQETVSRIQAAETAYEALNETQRLRVIGLEQLAELKEVCGGESWQQFAALTEDGALLTELKAGEPEVIPAAPQEETPPTEELGETEVGEDQPQAEGELPENAVRTGDTIRYPFTAAAESYHTDVSYGEASVKVELVLPLTADKAVFDLEAMPWLEKTALSSGTCMIGEKETVCQILTGYKKLAADEESGIVIPGSFTETVSVKVLNMTHGEKISVILSAAMEHNTWDGVCQTHQMAEKLTVTTKAFSMHVPGSEQMQQANYETFLTQVTELGQQELTEEERYSASMKLLEKMAEVYKASGLTQLQYEELSKIIEQQNISYLRNIAEPADLSAWMATDFNNTCDYGKVAYNTSVRNTTVQRAALTAKTYRTVFANQEQIAEEGGEKVSTDNAVYVSKTIEGSDIENVFDITLQVITKDEVEEIYKDPNMAVVVVMDVSNTMKDSFLSGGTTTRYAAAMEAGKQFIESFAAQGGQLSRLGFVAFNTNGHKIFDLSPCSTSGQASNLINEMKNKTKRIMDNYVSGDKQRFTNMEAGLKMANDMLKDAPNAHKYVIFITDGFPTTYISSGYTGYNPYNTTSATDGNTRNSYGQNKFYDKVLNRYNTYGTSYSDTAAIQARKMASTMKANGINIFSIGVDVSGQTLSYYNRFSYYSNGFSVVERMGTQQDYNNTGYEIGLKHSDLWLPQQVPDEGADNYDPAKHSQWEAYKPIEAQYFKNWLKGSGTKGIGSGYYYDSNDAKGLQDAFNQIFEKIVELNASSSHLDWVASDPMPDFGVQEKESIEFIGFYNADGALVKELTVDLQEGESLIGRFNENTATFDEDTQTIHWDLKDSGYQSISYGNMTMYQCMMSYRIRLKNEDALFQEGTVYDTNDTTTLTYRIIDVSGGQTVISDRKSIDFPIPAVKGYLSELNFRKTDPTGAPLANAQFQLVHDDGVNGSCKLCRGDGKNAVEIADMTAKSDYAGMVSFQRIPSGHTYILKEISAPDGYIKTENLYKVVVAYDHQTVTILDPEGKPLDLQWDPANPVIVNDMYYVLPETGGTGRSHFANIGLLLTAFSLVYICMLVRKRQKGGR